MESVQCPLDAVQRWQLSAISRLTKTASATLWKAYSNYYHTTTVIKQIDDTESFTHEVAALTAYNGKGCVSLLDFHMPANTFIMNCIEPGTQLTSLFPGNDSLATQHAYDIMQQLHSAPIPTTITRTVADWFKILTTQNTEKLPSDMIIKARRLADILLTVNTPYVLLHGDLHHTNIVKNNTHNWISLDPKGILGPALLECGAFMCNPISALYLQHNVTNIIKNRLTIFAHALSTSTQEIAQASYIHAVIAACWCLEDKSNAQPFIAIAHILSEYI